MHNKRKANGAPDLAPPESKRAAHYSLQNEITKFTSAQAVAFSDSKECTDNFFKLLDGCFVFDDKVSIDSYWDLLSYYSIIRINKNYELSPRRILNLERFLNHCETVVLPYYLRQMNEENTPQLIEELRQDLIRTHLRKDPPDVASALKLIRDKKTQVVDAFLDEFNSLLKEKTLILGDAEQRLLTDILVKYWKATEALFNLKKLNDDQIEEARFKFNALLNYCAPNPNLGKQILDDQYHRELAKACSRKFFQNLVHYDGSNLPNPLKAVQKAIPEEKKPRAIDTTLVPIFTTQNTGQCGQANPKDGEHANRFKKININPKVSHQTIVTESVLPEIVYQIHPKEFVDGHLQKLANLASLFGTPLPVDHDGFQGKFLGQTYLDPHMMQAVIQSIHAMLQAVDLTLSFEKVRTAICLSRPPTHHATRTKAEGFCFLNTTAIAALYLQQKLRSQGKSDVCLFIDIDFHHGNGLVDIIDQLENAWIINFYNPEIWPVNQGPHRQPPVKKNVINIPLMPGTKPDEFLTKLKQSLESLQLPGAPNIYMDLGVDGHKKEALEEDNNWELESATFGKAFNMISQFKYHTTSGPKAPERIIMNIQGGYGAEHVAESFDEILLATHHFHVQNLKAHAERRKTPPLQPGSHLLFGGISAPGKAPFNAPAAEGMEMKQR